jgi:protease-4
MRRNPWLILVTLLLVFGGFFVYLLKYSTCSIFGNDEPKITSKNSILKLELEGVIIDGKKFIKQLKKYREDDKIKAVVVEVNSPGGVVGPSQEIYQEILDTREVYKKPVVMVSTGLMASGAYYAAVAADKVIVAPGAMLGSIGVIMEFINLEKLYDWAKVSRYTIKTGKYKDSGAEYRAMRPDEKDLFQDLINDVFNQFKEAVAKGRNLKPDFVSQYADGRVFTGAQGVKLGFADEVGTVEDAYDIAADLAGLDDYEIFDIPKRRPGLLDILQGPEDEASAHSFFQVPRGGFESAIEGAFRKIFHSELANRPLYLMPGSW